MAKQKMTSKKRMTPAQKYERLDRRYSNFTAGAISIHNAWLGFIAIAKEQGLYQGRQKMKIDREHFEAVVREWRADKITAVDAMKRLDVKPNTFYRRVKEWGL